MSYHVGNARLRASAETLTRTFEPWDPFEVLNAEHTDPEGHAPRVFYRLRHIAVLDVTFEIGVRADAVPPDYILVRLPSAINAMLPARAQQALAVCARHGKAIPSERWVSTGVALVDPTGGGAMAHYIRIGCDTGFMRDHRYDISAQLTLELD